MIRRTSVTAGLALLLGGAAPPLAFVPLEPRHAGAATLYRQIWDEEGPRIVAALETESGLDFPESPIEAIVRDGPPMASPDGRTIRLRASRSADYMRATLVHEMGHRLALALPRTAQIDDHRALYLFLYDAWTDLYGRDFADRMVALERRIPAAYDYDAAWSWALAMTHEQRRAQLAALQSGQTKANQSEVSRRPKLR